MKYYPIFILLFLIPPVFAQTKLPVIKATSKNVAINDGGYLDKNAWSLSPNIKLDVFTADRTRKTKWVTFYTDIDSIKVKLKPGTRFNFVVVLSGKDSCYTQIASAIPSKSILKAQAIIDSISFTLTAYNAIAVKAIINNTDTLMLHFDASSFDFRFTKDAILKKTRLLSNQPNVMSGKAAADYNKMGRVFKLQMGNAIWNNPDVAATGLTAHDMDGRFGWNLFEGKTVEVNFDKNLLIIRPELPHDLKGYTKSKLEFIRSFICAKGTFLIDGKKYRGKFLIDNGSDQAMILDSSWTAKQNFAAGLKVIKSAILHDPRGVRYETKTVLIPAFNLNGIEVAGIPARILPAKNPVGFEINYFGNDLLKRFNIIFDFKNDYLYLQPNKLMGVKYRDGA